MSDSDSNPLAERTGTIVLDFEDRRRLACSDVLMQMEKSESRAIYPAQFGETVLRWIADPAEVVAMGDRMMTVLSNTLRGV